jgi:hypothetical protein
MRFGIPALLGLCLCLSTTLLWIKRCEPLQVITHKCHWECWLNEGCVDWTGSHCGEVDRVTGCCTKLNLPSDSVCEVCQSTFIDCLSCCLVLSTALPSIEPRYLWSRCHWMCYPRHGNTSHYCPRSYSPRQQQQVPPTRRPPVDTAGHTFVLPVPATNETLPPPPPIEYIEFH